MRTGRLVRIIAALVFVAIHPALPADTGSPAPPSLQRLNATDEEVFPGGPGTSPATLGFGTAISVHRGTALVGMPLFSDPAATLGENGRVAVFSRDRNGVWHRSGTLNPSDPVSEHQFGNRVALADRTALVAATSGIYVFRREHNTWREVQKIVPREGERFEGGLAVLDDAAFIATVSDDEAGAVRVFRIDKRGRLHRMQRLMADDGDPAKRFGEQIAAEGNTLLVGAPGDSAAQGAAYVFRGFGPFWFQRQKLIAINGAPGEEFGAAVAIDEGRIAIGAPGANSVPNTDCPSPNNGAAYVFEKHRQVWFQQHELPRPHDITACEFGMGEQVEISRNWTVVTLPTSLSFTDGHVLPFERVGGEYVLRRDLVSDAEFSAVILELYGSALFLGYPFDRAFSTGFVNVQQLTRSNTE
jgi:hypothetical protein